MRCYGTVMCALLSTADIAPSICDVRKVPIPEVAASSDHPVGAGSFGQSRFPKALSHQLRV